MSKYPLVKIEDVANNLDSKRIPLNSQQRKLKESNPLYPYIGANNILGYIDEYIFDEKILCIAEDGGSWGQLEKCSMVIDEKCWVNNHAHVLKAKDNLSLEYLSYYLNYSDLNSHITGSTRGKLNKGRLNQIKIPLPLLKTQQRIAEILDNAAALRDKTAQLLTEYDLLAQSIFLDMFGDPVVNSKRHSEVTLKSTIDIIIDYRGKTPPKSKKGITLLSSANVKKGKIDLNYEQYISEEEFKKWTVRGFTKPGDLLFTTEAPVGEVALIPNDKVTYQISRRVMALRFDNSKLNNIFALYQFLNSNWSNRLKKVTRGSTVPRVLKPDILGQKIICPPLKLQNQFAEKITLIEQQKALAKQELKEAEDLFNCLLQKAFKGELV